MNVQCYGRSSTGAVALVSDTTYPVHITGTRASDGAKVEFDAERSELRVATVPEGYNKYSVRLDDDLCQEATVEVGVLVNHACDLLTKEDLGITGHDYIEITYLQIL